MTKTFFKLFLLITLSAGIPTGVTAQKKGYDPTAELMKIEKKEIRKQAEILKKITFKAAKERYGNPPERDTIVITQELLDRYLSDRQIKKNFFDKAYLKEKMHLLEASWQRQSGSWITVWYKKELDGWKPVNHLITF